MNGLLTFTNLFPNDAMPTHGVFVRERMARVARLLDWPWHVLAPVPRVPRLLRRGVYHKWASLPPVSDRDGIAVHHPTYVHWPGLSLHRQPARMARAALPVARSITVGGGWVVDAHYAYPDGVAAAQVAGELGLPYVITARGTDIHLLARQPSIAAQVRAAGQGAAGLCAVSPTLAAAMAEVVGREVAVVRNGVDLQRFAPGDRAAARRALGLPATGSLVLGVGRLVANKGFADAVRALTTLGDPAQLVLVGDGPEGAALARNPQVIALGNRSPDEVAQAYRACDVLVLPSIREGWPNVVTEALASGLPVVAYAVGGIPHILGGESGVGEVVPVGDVDALARGLGRFLATPADRDKVRQFATRYSWDGPVEEMAAILRAAAAK